MTNADDTHTDDTHTDDTHAVDAGRGGLARRPARLVRLPGGGRWLAALAASLLVAWVALLGSGPARAATIDGAITSITTTATSTAQWDRVDLACTWAVPDGSAPGDTFTLRLPPELRWFGSTDFALAAPDGQPVARAHAGADGTVVFTLTDYVLTHPVDLHGSCHFSTQYVATTTDETVHLDFQVGDQVIRVDLGTVGPCTASCAVDRTEASKYMWWYDAAQTVTQSVIRAPATTSDLSDVTISDTPGPGLALDCATLTVTIGKVLDATGNVTAPRDDATYVPAVSCTTQAVSVTWSDVPAGEYTELWVRADVVDPSAATYTNAGSVVVDGQTTPVHDQVRHSEAGGDGEGTPSPTTTTTSPPTSTTTSPTVTTTTSPTTAPSTTATGTGTVTALATTDDTVVSSGGGSTTAAAQTVTDSVLAFTGVAVVQRVALALGLLGAGALVAGLGRRARRH